MFFRIGGRACENAERRTSRVRALLMQEISKPLSNETLRFMPMICFLSAQRIAVYGAQTIVAAVAPDSHRDPEVILRAIVSAYAWHTAIEEYGRLGASEAMRPGSSVKPASSLRVAP